MNHNYRHFQIRTHERTPGRWHATVQRRDGNNLTFRDGSQRLSFTTLTAAPTEEAALQQGIRAISDQGMD